MVADYAPKKYVMYLMQLPWYKIKKTLVGTKVFKNYLLTKITRLQLQDI